MREPVVGQRVCCAAVSSAQVPGPPGVCTRVALGCAQIAGRAGGRGQRNAQDDRLITVAIPSTAAAVSSTTGTTVQSL